MAINNQIVTAQDATRDNIRRRVLKLERDNLAQKPDGLKDREMVERIKKIIEHEVDRNDH